MADAAPSLDALARLAAEAQACLDARDDHPTWETAESLARGLVAAVDALRAERELTAKLRQSWGASFNSLSDLRTAVIGLANGATLPPPGVLDERHGTNIADALRAVDALRAERERRDALAAAVREERVARALADQARDDFAERRLSHEAIAGMAFDRMDKRGAEYRTALARLDALLSGAAPDVVRAGVVRRAAVSAFVTWLRRHDPLTGAAELASIAEEEGATMIGELIDAALAAAEGR